MSLITTTKRAKLIVAQQIEAVCKANEIEFPHEAIFADDIDVSLEMFLKLILPELINISKLKGKDELFETLQKLDRLK